MPKRAAPSSVRFALPRGGDREALLDAAYEAIADAWVLVEEGKAGPVVRLRPRPGARAGAGERLRAAYARAAERRRARKADLAAEAAALSRAVEMADRVDARRREAPPSLPPERREEIARLLAEADAAPKDPLGIAATWQELRRRGGGA